MNGLYGKVLALAKRKTLDLLREQNPLLGVIGVSGIGINFEDAGLIAEYMVGIH